jgi:hypothetical protein
VSSTVGCVGADGVGWVSVYFPHCCILCVGAGDCFAAVLSDSFIDFLKVFSAKTALLILGYMRTIIF